MQPPPPPQDQPLSEQRESPQLGKSPSQQYRLFEFPLVFCRQSFGQLLQSSPALSLLQTGVSQVSVLSLQTDLAPQGSPVDWHDPASQNSSPLQDSPGRPGSRLWSPIQGPLANIPRLPLHLNGKMLNR